MKKPSLAFALSFLIPGAGLAYIGKWSWAVLNLGLVLGVDVIAGFVIPKTSFNKSILSLLIGCASVSAGFAENIAKQMNKGQEEQSSSRVADAHAKSVKGNSALASIYLRAVGGLTAHTIGFIDHYSLIHRTFLSSGFICQGCAQRLSYDEFICYDNKDQPVATMQIRSKGQYFKCGKCGYRWDFREPKKL